VVVVLLVVVVQISLSSKDEALLNDS